MAHIFISCSRKDRGRVAPLVDALVNEGYEVWWFLDIRSGEPFDKKIERKLEQACCVVALWSKNSVESDWVRAESTWAVKNEKFISIRIDDDIKIPLEFTHIHTDSMVGYKTYRDTRAFKKLIADIKKIPGTLPSPEQMLETKPSAQQKEKVQ